MKSKIALVLLIIFTAGLAHAQMTLPSINLGLKSTDNPQEIVSAIRIVLALTVLTLAPAILIMMTSFTRLIIVFSFLRQGANNRTQTIAFASRVAANGNEPYRISGFFK